MNRVTLYGRLGRNPDSKRTANQTAVCNFSVATSERRKNAEGEWVEATEWHNIVTWGKQAESCEKYLTKGSQVLIEGRLQTDKYEKDGVTKYSTKIIAEKVQFLGGKSEAKQEPQDSSVGDTTVSGLAEARKQQEIDDDSIPF